MVQCRDVSNWKSVTGETCNDFVTAPELCTTLLSTDEEHGLTGAKACCACDNGGMHPCLVGSSGQDRLEGFNTSLFPTWFDEPSVLAVDCEGCFTPEPSQWRTPLTIRCGLNGTFEVVDGTALCVVQKCSATRFHNGAGGYIYSETLPNDVTTRVELRDLASRKAFALAGCESRHGPGTCEEGECHDFRYYYFKKDIDCDCRKPAGTYEWVFDNPGKTKVFDDYVDAKALNITDAAPNTDIAGDNLFVRKRLLAECTTFSWTVSLLNFGGA